jgi:hypothetical protein
MLRLQMLEKILNDKWTLQSDDKEHDCNVS